MTRDRDIERVLDRFYAEGPSEMPDRVLLGVFDRIERVPQRRLAIQLTRFAIMNTNLRIALAAAIVVAVVGIGAFALSQRSNVGAQPTPSPTAAPNPSANTFEPTSVPPALQSRWVGEPRVVPQAPEPPYRNALKLDGGGLSFALAESGSATEFASVASLVAPDQIRLRMATTEAGCRTGDEGTYSFTLSAEGTALSFAAIADQCQPRSAAIGGEWQRVGCSDTNGWCLGDLTPGLHKSVVFSPFVEPASWKYNYGAFSYTVPAGWANTEDCPGCFDLTKQGGPIDAAVHLFSDIVAHAAYGSACQDDIAAGVGRSAAAIATYLTKRPGLVATTPTPITLGGLTGLTFDISVDPSWTATCSFSNGRPVVATFTDSDPATGGLDWNVSGDGRTRIILLDMPDGRALLIDIEAQTKAAYDALLPEAMQVVGTFGFRQ